MLNHKLICLLLVLASSCVKRPEILSSLWRRVTCLTTILNAIFPTVAVRFLLLYDTWKFGAFFLVS